MLMSGEGTGAIRRRRSGWYSSIFFCLAVFFPFWLALNAALIQNKVSAQLKGALAGTYQTGGQSEAERAYWQGLMAAMNPSLSEREAGEIGMAVLRYSSRYGLEPGLVAAIIKVESHGNPFAVSSKGGRGSCR